jgi:hypothetical protein
MTTMTREPLPAMLGSIEDAAGYEVAIKIAMTYGGGYLRLPVHPAGTALAKLVGEEAARLVAAIRPGEEVYIPLAKPACARYLAAKGESLAEIRRVLKASHASVDNWVHGRKNPGQLTLAI